MRTKGFTIVLDFLGSLSLCDRSHLIREILESSPNEQLKGLLINWVSKNVDSCISTLDSKESSVEEEMCQLDELLRDLFSQYLGNGCEVVRNCAFLGSLLSFLYYLQVKEKSRSEAGKYPLFLRSEKGQRKLSKLVNDLKSEIGRSVQEVNEKLLSMNNGTAEPQKSVAGLPELSDEEKKEGLMGAMSSLNLLNFAVDRYLDS